MAENSEHTRGHGIEFGTLATDLDDESYPLTHERLLSQYGDYEIGLPDSDVPLHEILSPETEQEYEDPESVRQTILNLVGSDAVGREGYSDRGGYTPDADGATEGESF
jgi:hypothetical protein